MLQSIGMVIIAIIITLLEVPSLIKQKHKNDVAVFSVVLTISTTLIILRIMYIPVPNPMDGIMAIFSPISYWFDQLLS